MIAPRWIRHAAAAALLLAVACESGTDTKTPEVVEIHLTSQNQFSPNEVTVERGTIVRFINDAQRGHTITLRDRSQPGGWQEAFVADPGQTFQHVFDTPGTYAYYCRPHEARFSMIGTITVQ